MVSYYGLSTHKGVIFMYIPALPRNEKHNNIHEKSKQKLNKYKYSVWVPTLVFPCMPMHYVQ